MENLEMLAVVARGLKQFTHETAFVGGAAVALHITDKAAPAPRPTDDVDCVVEVLSKVAFQKLEEDLLALGFKRPPVYEESTICRWKYMGISVDMMPTDEKVLGFHNRWYSEGLREAKEFALEDGTVVRAFSLPHMIACKLEAFLNRGGGDFRGSHDLEDVFALLDGAPDAKEKILAGPDTVKKYLAEKFAEFLGNPHFLESAEGHLPEPGRARRALTVLQDLL